MRQEALLRDLLAHAYERVPLYRSLYDEAGFRPADFRSLADLPRVPLLTKERLKSADPLDCVVRGADPARLSRVETSGSTGMPLAILLTARERAWQRAVAWRILFEHGYRLRDRTLEIRQNFGPAFAVQRLGLAAKDWLSILDPPDSWASHLCDRGHAVVVAGAGTLRALADAVVERGLAPPRPRLVFSDSETLDPETRARIAAGLGTDPIDVYGLVELSNFAWECERRRGFHVSADSHVVEVLDADPDGLGDLVATDLGLRVMPMIRYATGDVGAWAAEACPCGRVLPRLARVVGRAVDSVRLPDGRRLFWPFFHELFAAHPELERWRVVQEAPRRLRVELALGARDRDRAGPVCDGVAHQLAQVLPPELEIDIRRRDAIPVAPGEKTRMVLCRL
ncbi:MAG: hypothetical protein MJE66_09560 [Proteobacteria bacterium]|nr:hypothetical protein [Pseudomonadota bacterium]